MKARNRSSMLYARRWLKRCPVCESATRTTGWKVGFSPLLTPVRSPWIMSISCTRNRLFRSLKKLYMCLTHGNTVLQQCQRAAAPIHQPWRLELNFRSTHQVKLITYIQGGMPLQIFSEVPIAHPRWYHAYGGRLWEIGSSTEERNYIFVNGSAPYLNFAA